VAANEIRDFERRHHSVWQSARRERPIRRLRRVRSMRRFRVRRLPHRYLHARAASNAIVRRLILGSDEPSRNGAAGGRSAEGDRLTRRTRSGGIQSAALNARSNRRRAGGRCVADVRDASNSERPCRASSRSETSHATVTRKIHRPLGGAPGCGWAMCRPPSVRGSR
jgi:hypothetical protein